MILNYFILKNWNLAVYKNSVILFNSIIKNKYKHNFIVSLNFPQTYKYNWCSNYSFFIKYINLNFINVVNLDNYNFKKESINSRVNNIIFFKKRSSIFKKSAEFEFSIMNYVTKTRDDFYVNSGVHVLDNIDFVENKPVKHKFNYVLNFSSKYKDTLRNKKIISNKYNMSYKTIDFKRKINMVYRQNRVLLRKFLKVKFKRQNTFNRYIKNLTKLNHVSFFHNFEYRLVSLLTRSLFFFNYKDCMWFMKNGYISVNGFVNYNIKRLLKPFEVVNLSFNNYYFFYYRFMLDNCISNLYKFNTKIWKINQQRNNRKKHKKEESYHNWIHKYSYYREDIPKFLEVDFISMSMVLLNYSFNRNYVDFYNIKFLNLYLNRLYNWKFII